MACVCPSTSPVVHFWKSRPKTRLPMINLPKFPIPFSSNCLPSSRPGTTLTFSVSSRFPNRATTSSKKPCQINFPGQPKSVLRQSARLSVPNSPVGLCSPWSWLQFLLSPTSLGLSGVYPGLTLLGNSELPPSLPCCMTLS